MKDMDMAEYFYKNGYEAGFNAATELLSTKLSDSQYCYVTWSDVELYVNWLVDKFKDSRLTGVYGPPRGGIPIAVMLSHRLDIPLLMAPCKGCLIVDDIFDSGETLKHYIANTSGSAHEKMYIVTTMFIRSCSKDLQFIPDEVFREVDNEWVIFPWEKRK